MRRAHRLLLGAVSGAAVLSATACGAEITGSPATTAAPVTVTEVVTAPAEAADPETAVPEATTPTPAAPAAPTRAAADANAFRQDGGYYFHSASDKFHCGILASAGIAGCHGRIPADAPAQPLPGGSGQRAKPNAVLVDGSGAGRFVFQGDAPFYPNSRPPTSRVLPYGTPLTAAGFTCLVAETTGVTCRNDSTGSGFTVSDSAYRVF
ncbi:MAG: hypothetical protein QM809_08005 [Gordonia sp. (in: high G+C Gram-positive bacteria)]|uniref:hypothetical protein n=1 Tax=Gordonia sp. (in: high G+C Gram-positive bacteria) TaxID=84139 RepID=UPI0039E577CD